MRVIINRSDAIGDSILTMPMAKAIKKKYPNAKILFLISSKSKDLFINHLDVDETWVYNRSISFITRNIDLFKVFKRFKPDAYFYAGGGHSPTFIAFLLGVPIRGGLKSKWQTFLFLNRGIRQRRSTVEMHESDYNLDLLKAIDIEYNHMDRASYAPTINLSQVEVENSWNNFLLELKPSAELPKEMIVIHPGMMGHTLNWPIRNYVRLIEHIERDYPQHYFFVVSHTPSDNKVIEEFKDELQKDDLLPIRSKVFFYDGSIHGLRTYMSVISKAALFVGPSTGTSHIANTLGIKQVAIYSPIRVQSVMRWGPFNRYNGKLKIVVPDAVCGEQFKCQGIECPYYFCMDKIEIDDVFEQVKELLTRKEVV